VRLPVFLCFSFCISLLVCVFVVRHKYRLLTWQSLSLSLFLYFMSPLSLFFVVSTHCLLPQSVCLYVCRFLSLCLSLPEYTIYIYIPLSLSLSLGAFLVFLLLSLALYFFLCASVNFPSSQSLSHSEYDFCIYFSLPENTSCSSSFCLWLYISFFVLIFFVPFSQYLSLALTLFFSLYLCVSQISVYLAKRFFL
jgi:hypothetical protein